MPKKSMKHICQWCGEGFTAQHSIGHKPLFCSDECRKHYRRNYNATFQAKKRAAMTDEQLEPNRLTSRKCAAQRTWNKWSEQADIILSLAESKHPKEAITKFLIDHFRPRAKNQPAPNLSTLAVAKMADRAIEKVIAN